MSRPQVEEFSVKVKFDLNGKPESIRYYDADGCGHESTDMSLEYTVRGLVDYHLQHLRRSHDMEPIIPCPVYVLASRVSKTSLEQKKVKVYCNNEEGKGHEGNHTFSVSGNIYA